MGGTANMSQPYIYARARSTNDNHKMELGTMVEVKVQRKSLYGVLRWFGTDERIGKEILAGLELEDDLPIDYEEIGCTDGTYMGRRFFHSQIERAFFVTLSSIKPDSRRASESTYISTPSSGTKENAKMELGTMAEVKVQRKFLYGVLRWFGTDERIGEEILAGLELEDDLPINYKEIGCTDGTYMGRRFFHSQIERALFVKLSSIKPDSRHASESTYISSGTKENAKMELGTMVEVEVQRKSLYGVLRWFGTDERIGEEILAGLELEDDLPIDYEEIGCTDGTYMGRRFFHSQIERAFFVKLSVCQTDSRWKKCVHDF